ncbi:MAG: protein kinase [Ktedonobacteraceae bacterium]|nr:protein kinase [Ktedonobacteraceae bacterium]
MICSHCGTHNVAGDQFCSQCGAHLLANVAASTVVSSSSTPPTMVPPTLSAMTRVTGALQPQTLLSARYRVLRLVGKGGFGAVYEAGDEHFQGQHTVAVKEMSDSHLRPAEKQSALSDFRREAHLLVALRHPNLPLVSDFFEEGNKAYLVMEFIEGKTLEKVQEDANAPLDEPRVMDWALQLCDVLEYLHGQNPPIIFRDMKPSNVMLDQRGQIKLIDFGIARAFNAAAAKDTSALGSRGYAPLEQYGRGQSDARSDIYALGATLYDLLTHEVPPDAPARRLHPTLFQKPRQLNPHLSVATEKIILKALEEEPGKRFQSATDFRQAILASQSPGRPLPPRGYVAQQPSSPPPPAPIAGQAPTSAVPAATAGQVQVAHPPVTPQQPSRFSRRKLLIGGVAATAAVAGGAFAYQKFAPAIIGPNVPLDFVYSTEKDTWLAAALEAFHNSDASRRNNKNIRVQPATSGSLDLTSRILSGEVKPVAWSPASSLEVNRLNSEWQRQHGGQSIVTNDLQPLVLSPLVFAIWEDRARVLLNKFSRIDWDTLSAALRAEHGWTDLGGPAEWQRVSLGQTRPDESNSGLLTITLMAYAFHQKSQGLSVDDVDDPSFLAYLKVFEDAVTAFGHSSGTYLEREVILKGAGAYDITATYENLVLTSQDEVRRRQSQRLLLYYPHVNIVSDHPFVFLKGPWTNQETLDAARSLRDFLLSEAQQRQVLRYGLRPTHSNVHINDKTSDNLFASPALNASIRSDYVSVQVPSGQVVNELLTQWLTHYQDAATGNG